jgi:protein-export membrane protein SecD
MISKKILFLLLLIALTLACRAFSKVFDKSGVLLTIQVESIEANPERTTDLTANVLRNRLKALGVNGEVSGTTLPNRLEVKIYDTENLERTKQILQAEGRFEIRKVISPAYPAPIQTYPTREAALASLGGVVPAERKIFVMADRQSKDSKHWIVVENPPVIDGSEVRDAIAQSESGSDKDYKIVFSLKPAGAQKFAIWTSANINNYLAIVLNDEVKSAAFIKSQIGDSGELAGNFTKQQAEDLALVMKSGYLPTKLTLIDEKTFGK